MHCENCSAEIFAGQRFCRSCGRPTEQHPEENVPTQMMPPGGQRGHADTAPPANPYTSPVYTPPGYYQPVAPLSPVPAYLPPRSRSGWGWIVAMIGVVVFSFIIMGFFVFSRGRRAPMRPLDPPSSPASSVGVPGGLSRADAVETNRETRLAPSTFPLSASSKFSIQSFSGDINIEGWDRPEAQVTAIIRGASIEERRSVGVIVSTDRGDLSLRPSGRKDISIEYTIKLPRRLAGIALEATDSDVVLSGVGGGVSVTSLSGDVSISSVKGGVTVSTKSGSVDVSRITGDVSITVLSGSIELADVDGAVEARTISGGMSAVFNSVAPGKPLKFQTTSGDVELQIKPEVDADLKAQTKTGDIEIDEAFGIEVEKQMVGARAGGQIGKGGLPLNIETISGDIRITK